MEENYICPLMSKAEKTVPCEEENCALWTRYTDKTSYCAFVVSALNQFYIAEKVDDVAQILKYRH